MKSKNFISNSLKESFLIIKKNKKIIFLLFVLQIISLALVFSINIRYQSKMLESTRTVIEYVEKQDLDQESVGLNILQQKNPLGPDPLLISRNFKDIVYNLKFLIFYSLIVFILLNGLMWFLTGNLTNKNFKLIKINIKNLIKYIVKFGFVTLIFFSLIYLFLSSTLKSSLNPLAEAQEGNFAVSFLITLALVYFMYIAFSLLHKTELRNLLKKLFKIGIKKAHVILLAYLIIIFVISVVSYSLFYFMEKNLFLLSISIILFVGIFIWSRIFLVLVVDKLS